MYNFVFREETTLLLLKHSLSWLLPFILILFLFKWFNHTPKNLPPSPPKLPIIGNLHQLGSVPQRSLKSLAKKYGPVMLLQLGSKPVLIISSADAAEEVLRKHDLIFADRPKKNFGGRLSYNFKNIAFAPFGEYWRQVRSICVLQLLTYKRVQSFKIVREEEIAKMLEKVKKSCLSGSAICMSEILASLTNNIVSVVAIGKRYSGEKYGSRFKKLFEDAAMLAGYFNVADYIPWLGWINHINGLEAKVTGVAKEFDKYFENIVVEGMKRLEKKKNNDGESEGKEEQQNFMDVLLEFSGFSIDRDSIKAIISDVFLAGMDTTYSLLEWAISELLRNQNATTKLQNEVRSEFSDCKSDHITDDDLEKLPYLKAFIKETLRLHPPVPLLLPRESRKDFKMLGYDIAAKTQVIINAWAIGRDPRLWEDVDEFRPERFLNSPVDFKGQHFEFIPFGSGRRSCPGSGFAILIAELALANLIRNFNFALTGGAKPEELDMTETPGTVAGRKNPLVLVASLPNKKEICTTVLGLI